VYVRTEDGVGLRPNIGIRGVNPDRSKKVTLLEDGILFGPAPYSAPAAYYFPLVTRMTAVRVIKGPGAIAYGPQTVGGAIDFVTRPIPVDTAGGLDVAFGEYGYNKLHGHFGASHDRFGFLIEGLRLHNEGFKELPNDADTGSTRNDWMAKFSYVLDPEADTTHTFDLKVSYSDELSNETYLGLTDEDFRENPYRRYPASALDRMKNHRTGVVLSHTLERPGVFQLKTQLYRQDFARVWRKVNRFRGSSLFDVLRRPELAENQVLYEVLSGQSDSVSGGDVLMIGPNDRTFVSQGLTSSVSARAETGPFLHRLEAAVRLHNDEIVRRHSESGFRMLGGRLVPDGTPTLATEANTGRSYAAAFHAMDAVSWGRMTLTPGVRVELIDSELVDEMDGGTSERFVAAVLPGVGFYTGLTDEFGLLAGVYRGFTPPPPGSREDVKPEYSVNYELGGRLSLGRARAELIAFYNDYSNLTNTCTFASGCSESDIDRQFDAGRARIYGFEAYASHDVPLGPIALPLYASYTLTRAEFSRSFTSDDPIFGEVEQGDEIPYVPRHQLSASAGVENRAFGAVAALNYVAAMREEPGRGSLDSTLTTDEQLWLDLGVHGRPLTFLKLYANLRNALNAQDIVSRRPYGARPNAPRWLQVGAKVEF
ncbi:MAG TPA: TonB-dependent receptor, partial [Polyangiaceae bacterium]